MYIVFFFLEKQIIFQNSQKTSSKFLKIEVIQNT